MCTPVTVARAVRPLAVLVLVTWPTAVAQVAHALARHQELLAVQAARPALRVLRALRLLLADCSAKVAAAVAVVLLAQAAQAVRAVAALVVAAVVQPAVHMPQAPVV